MIEQFLNREFMVGVAEGTGAQIASELRRRESPRRGGASHPIDAIETEELAELAVRIAELSDEFIRPGDGDDAPQRRSTDRNAPPKDDFVFLPHNQLMCLIQSAVDQSVEDHAPDAIETVSSTLPPGRRDGSSLDHHVTERRLRGLEFDTQRQGRRAWKQMEIAKGKWAWLSDPRWMVCLTAELWREATGGRLPFVDRPATLPIRNDALVVVVGDWGSGLERADSVAYQIQLELAKASNRQRVVVHLGDVYYSGTRREFDRRFLNTWPVGSNSDTISLAVPGNHELYSGGHGYYSVALADHRFSKQNGCSFFALKNDYWQFLGLDTAYEDGGLYGAQAQWAVNKIQQAPPGLRTCLLSHHQLFSAHEKTSRSLQSQITPVLETGRVDAWFWGHEHRCIQYGETRFEGHRVGFASCVGHGGVPEYLVMKQGETRPSPWEYEYLEKHGDGLEPWNTFGFAVLDLKDECMRVRYINESGEEHFSVANVLER